MGTAIGLDIGSSAVRAVQLSRTRSGGPTLDRLGQVVLPPGAVVDGTIHDPAAVTECLGILYRQFGFSHRRVALGLADQKVVVRRVDLPLLPEEGFRDALRAQAADHLPVAMEQVQLDHVFVEEFTHDDGVTRMMRLLLVAADTAMVQQVIDVVRRAKLKPVKVDLDAFAVLRALRDTSPAADRYDPFAGELVVDLGAHLTGIVAHAQGTPRFVRTIPLGGDDITDSLASAFDLPWEQADTLKAVTPSAASPYSGLLEERIAGLIAEVVNSVTYFRTEPGGVHLQRVVLTGGTSLIPGIEDRMADALRLDVVHGHPFAGVAIGQVPLGPEDLEAAQPFMAAATGLALGVLR